MTLITKSRARSHWWIASLGGTEAPLDGPKKPTADFRICAMVSFAGYAVTAPLFDAGNMPVRKACVPKPAPKRRARNRRLTVDAHLVIDMACNSCSSPWLELDAQV